MSKTSETLLPVKGYKLLVPKNRKLLVKMFGIKTFAKAMKKIVKEVKKEKEKN
ncbi:MAG: hypothetical protein Q7K42_00085 [Candidatus Diapherotrites archaeon]|nr:hypothetical protein [Candidatus Diapherotrites archaeon]